MAQLPRLIEGERRMMRGRWMRIERERRPELLSAVSNGRNVIIRRRRSRLEREKITQRTFLDLFPRRIMIPIYVTHKKFRRHRNDNKILFKIFSTETV